jgi:hypothetical protein
MQPTSDVIFPEGSMDTEGWKIIQIMPPGDWCATFNDTEDGEYHDPLAAWALVEGSDGERFVTGLTTGGGYMRTDFSECASNFVGYYHPKATGPMRPGVTVL